MSIIRPAPIHSQVVVITSNAAVPEHRLCTEQESLSNNIAIYLLDILNAFPETVNSMSREMQLDLTN